MNIVVETMFQMPMAKAVTRKLRQVTALLREEATMAVTNDVVFEG
jgi:hypothetical protein